MSFTTQQYAWKDVKMFIGGRRFRQFIGVEYDQEIEREYVYGEGDEPQAIQDGNKKYSGKIKLLQSELEGLIAGAPDRDILKYNYFDVVVTYLAEGVFVTDILKNCKFTKMCKNK